MTVGYNTTEQFTLLSLARYSQIMGIDPYNFFGGNVNSLKNVSDCNDVYYQFRYQDGERISREQLLYNIRQAEEDLIAIIGYLPAPYWIASERQPYPQLYLKEYKGVTGYNASGFGMKSVQANLGYVISGGIRATSQIAANDIVRGSDIDTTGDGFTDTAVFTVTVDFTSICELQAYFKEYSAVDAANTRTDPQSEGADPYWQIRDIRISFDENVTATVYIPKYQLFKPQLQRQIDAGVIDADAVGSYVDTIEFYRIYNDPSSQVIFLFGNEAVCNETGCTWDTQTGCMRVKNARNGVVTVQPGTYAAATQTYSQDVFSHGIEPDWTQLNYYAGLQERSTFNRSCDQLSHWWAETIAMIATARLPEPLCGCLNVRQIAEDWRSDTAKNTEARTYITAGDIDNPLGTRLGEVLAWRRLKQTGRKKGRAIRVY